MADAVVPGTVESRKRSPWYRAKAQVMSVLGHLRFYRYPFFLLVKIPGYKFRDLYSLLDVIEPGDVILRKHDSYLNTYFIPGFYTHAGVCVDRRSVIHAVAGGVEQIDVPYFCRCDHVIVLRHRGLWALPEESRQSALNDVSERLRGKLGVEFDYDVAPDDERFYCSELAAYAYRQHSALEPRVHRLWGLIPTPLGIAPEDFLHHDDFDVVYRSSVDE